MEVVTFFGKIDHFFGVKRLFNSLVVYVKTIVNSKILRGLVEVVTFFFRKIDLFFLE